MNKLINLPVITAIVFFSVTACADWGAKSDLNPPEVCELKNGLLFSKDSILIELPYGKVVPVSYGNFSLEVYKIEGDVSEDICSKLTYPEVRVFVRIIQNNCREDLNYFQFGRCPQYGQPLILAPFQGCKISSDIIGYSWVMAYGNLLFSVNSLLPYAKTSDELKKLETAPSPYIFKIWIKKRC